MWAGGVNLPWNLALAGVLGASLLFKRLTVGAERAMADADHLIGFLALTVISLPAAEVARPLRYCLVPLGVALMVTPSLLGAIGILNPPRYAISHTPYDRCVGKGSECRSRVLRSQF